MFNRHSMPATGAPWPPVGVLPLPQLVTPMVGLFVRLTTVDDSGGGSAGVGEGEGDGEGDGDGDGAGEGGLPPCGGSLPPPPPPQPVRVTNIAVIIASRAILQNLLIGVPS